MSLHEFMPPYVPSRWHLANLRASPFLLTNPREEGQVLPAGLLVGRDAEVSTLLGTIVHYERGSTAQAVVGTRGCGKSALIAEVKVRAQEHHFIATDTVLYPRLTDSVDELRWALLGAVHEAIVVNCPDARERVQVREAGALLLERLRADPLTPSLKDPAVGSTARRALKSAAGTPVHIIQLLDAVTALLPYLHVRGVVLHARVPWDTRGIPGKQIADALSRLSAVLLTTERLHVLLELSLPLMTSAVEQAPSLRSEFRPVFLESLPAAAVLELLDRRFEYLRLDAARAPYRLRAPHVVRELHASMGGDLTQLLGGLHALIEPWLTLEYDASAGPSGTSA